MAGLTKKNRQSGAGKATALVLCALLLLAGARQPVQAASTDGQTTSEINLGVSESAAAVATVDFEVPLYYTMCVCTDDENKATVALPDKSIYTIKSGTKGGLKYNGTGTPENVEERRNQTKIAVTGMKIAKVQGGQWNLVEQTPTGNQRNMQLRIGGVNMPALNAAQAEQEVDLTTGGLNTFYNPDLNGAGQGGYIAIKGLGATEAEDPENEADTYTVVPVEAVVSPAYTFTDSEAAAAQFRVVYIISPIDEQGQIIKASGTGYDKQVHYEGPDEKGADVTQTWDIDKDGNLVEQTGG